jgi:hypothetical protein
MTARTFFSSLLMLLLVGHVAGCGKQRAESEQASIWKPSRETLARVHWIGKRKIDVDFNGYFLSRLWSLPETGKLQAQTFDKLATNIWKLALGESVGKEVPSAVLRPLFDDVTREECYWELGGKTNASWESCFAIHLDPQRAGVWETNLAVAAELIAGSPAVPTASGWRIKRAASGETITFVRIGEWAVLGVGSATNSVFAGITSHLAAGGLFSSNRGSNLTWLDIEVDADRITGLHQMLSGLQLEALSRVSLSFSGDGARVKTHGELKFSQPLRIIDEPWLIPTNLISGPLISFTAIRGFRTWDAAAKAWGKVNVQSPPNQLFLWSLPGNAFRTYAAWPMERTQADSMFSFLLGEGNTRLASSGYISFNPAFGGAGVMWGNLAAIQPFMKYTNSSGTDWLYAGLLQDSETSSKAWFETDISGFRTQTNLLYFHQELTGEQIQPRFAVYQTARQISRLNLLSEKSASLNWLAVLASRLGQSVTSLKLTTADQLDVERTSSIGITASELALLVSWLEAPDFPIGFSSL